ncbi:hypothetical protein GBAR_LOCUS9700, partial [Geodia barretti]
MHLNCLLGEGQMNRLSLLLLVLVAIISSMAIVACGSAEPQIVEVEVVKEVEVVREVEVEVVKEVPVDREVVKEVEVVREVEVVKEVIKEVVVVATPVRQAQEATFVMRAPEPNPKRGGNLRTAFGVTMTNFDVQQGAGPHVLGHLYNKLVTKNL